MVIIFLSLLSLCHCLPAEWWLNTEGIAIKTNAQFKELVSNDDATLKD